MSVYVANFGVENYEWPECLKRSTVSTVNEKDDYELWKRGDREGYIQARMKKLTVAGNVPTRAVASRWFNLMTTISETVGDVWLHRAGPKVWWTRSLDQPPTYYERVEPVETALDVVVCHKPCEPWRSQSETGVDLFWDGIHPKAKGFLATTATMMKLTPDNAAYAMALIRGEPLDHWHDRPDWTEKLNDAKTKNAKIYGGLDKCIWRMADTAFHTVQYANGQIVQKTVKNKDCDFPSKPELEAHIRGLIETQNGLCAITGLKLNYDDPLEDQEMCASLDRLDSSGHYTSGNLQVVCKFVNRWKGADDNAGFQRLVDILMGNTP